MGKFGEILIESLTDALAHAQGEASGVRVQTVEVPDVRAIVQKWLGHAQLTETMAQVA